MLENRLLTQLARRVECGDDSQTSSNKEHRAIFRDDSQRKLVTAETNEIIHVAILGGLPR